MNPISRPVPPLPAGLQTSTALPPWKAPQEAAALASEPSYQIIGRGPAPAADEIETTGEVIEVVCLWGETVLSVHHLRSGEAFRIGEPDAVHTSVDLLISTGVAGAHTLIDYREGAPAIALPADATSKGELSKDGTLVISMGEFSFRIRRVAEAKRVGLGLAALMVGASAVPVAYFASVALVMGIMFTAMSLLPPSASALSGDLMSPRDLRMVRVLIEPSETIIEDIPPPPTSGPHGDAGGASSTPQEGPSGEAGVETSPRTDRRRAVRGDSGQQRLPRESLEQQARTTGVLGAFARVESSWSGPTSVYGADRAIGEDDVTALGSLFGREPGENFGYNGLGPVGRGNGGGGPDRSVGLGDLTGTCTGPNCRYGLGDPDGPGGVGDGVTAGNPRIPRGPGQIRGSVETNGGLSREVIQRVIGRHRNEARHCYEQGLRNQPDLEGRVTVRFVISPTGAVTTSVPVAARSSLPSASVQMCVSQAVRRWSFPQPEGSGVVSVTYPFYFSSPN